jgi:phosphoadenosine phosphosulfate reductase
LEFEDIKRKVLDYQQQGKKIFTSSSFQTHSIPLLHIISRIDPSVPVYFINTGFHFPETLEYRDQIARLLGLNLIDLRPETPKSMQIGPDGKFLFSTDPDHCCHLNKTKPMESLLMHYDIWVNGIRADQSPFRKSMDVEQPAPHNVIRFHPLISWSTRMVHEYRKKYNLPEHPLEAKGYFSIGCEPCTRKHDPDLYEREARWYGLKKTECGLHTELVQTP